MKTSAIAPSQLLNSGFPKRVTRIARNDIPKIHSAMVDGIEHNLGVLHDFSWHAVLSKSFLSKLSISWVHLKSGESLSPHRHPTPSIVLVCKGSVRSMGEHIAVLEEGDALLIPAGASHGFIGTGEQGFWGLSIQPTNCGIYSKPSTPRVEFLKRDKPDWLVSLTKNNQQHLGNFVHNALFKTFESGLLNSPRKLETFLSYFQVWSDCFQELLQTRVESNTRSPLHSLALQHLEQERGHNLQLRNARAARTEEKWDPLVAAYCAWFRDRMQKSSEVEQTVLMHIIIEASADIFYSRFACIKTNDQLRHHIRDHIHHDAEHYEMGVRALEQVTVADEDTLLRLQEQGWQVLGSLFARFAELTEQ